MSRFKIGQKVVALASGFRVIKGKIYEVEGFICCPNCGDPCIYVTGISDYCFPQHMTCGWEARQSIRIFFTESGFAPLQNNADAIEYKMSVSIPELITIKEYQNQ